MAMATVWRSLLGSQGNSSGGFLSFVYGWPAAPCCTRARAASDIQISQINKPIDRDAVYPDLLDPTC
jgi:hypothetical protein